MMNNALKDKGIHIIISRYIHKKEQIWKIKKTLEQILDYKICYESNVYEDAQ